MMRWWPRRRALHRIATFGPRVLWLSRIKVEVRSKPGAGAPGTPDDRANLAPGEDLGCASSDEMRLVSEGLHSFIDAEIVPL